MFGYTATTATAPTRSTRAAPTVPPRLSTSLRKRRYSLARTGSGKASQKGVATYVNAPAQGGTAIIEQPVSERYDWLTTQSKYWKPRVGWVLGAVCE
jgi:hypothetical protein